MHDPEDLRQHLHTVWQQNFPLAVAMGLSPAQYRQGFLQSHAPLAANTNIHNTAFAGSLYAVQAMTAWGLLYLELHRAGLDASIIHGEGNIKFSRTIKTDLVAQIDMADIQQYVDEVRDTGKTRLQMETQVIADGEVCSAFSGSYYARLNT